VAAVAADRFGDRAFAPGEIVRQRLVIAPGGTQLAQRDVALCCDPHEIVHVRAMHAAAKRIAEPRVELVGEHDAAGAALERCEQTVQRELLDAACVELVDQVPADLHAGLGRLGARELIVDAHERDQAIEVVREAPLVAELFELHARADEIAGDLREPRAGDHAELVERRVAIARAMHEAVAPHACLVDAILAQQRERGLELLAARIVPDARELATREIVELRPARDRVRELALDVLDLREQAQRVEAVGVNFHHSRDLELRLEHPAQLDEDSAAQQSKLDRCHEQTVAPRSFTSSVRLHPEDALDDAQVITEHAWQQELRAYVLACGLAKRGARFLVGEQLDDPLRTVVRVTDQKLLVIGRKLHRDSARVSRDDRAFFPE
jgi:hypothetical protein